MIRNKALVFRPHVLKLARLSQSLSMYDTAQLMNAAISEATGESGRISSATISGWESGNSDPTAKSLGLWASVLNVNVADAFEVVQTDPYSLVRFGGRPRGSRD